MKYKRYFKRIVRGFIRDLSAFGNTFILLFILLLISDQFIVAALGLLFVVVISNVLKVVFFRRRPNPIEHNNLMEKMQSGSFPSLHSAQAMYIFSIAILNTKSIILDTLFVLMILGVGYSRIYLKKHFLTDVVGGYVIGFLIFLLIIL